MTQTKISRQDKKQITQLMKDSPEAIDSIIQDALPAFKTAMVQSALKEARTQFPMDLPPLSSEVLDLLQNDFLKAAGPKMKDHLIDVDFSKQIPDNLPTVFKGALTQHFKEYLRDHFEADILPEIGKGIVSILRERSPEPTQANDATQQELVKALQERAVLNEVKPSTTSIKPRTPTV